MTSRRPTLWETWRARRDDAAFEALVAPDLGRALGVARGVGCSVEDAEDAVQDALVRLATERTDEPKRVGVRAWFLRAVRERAGTRLRSSRRRRKRERAAARPESVTATDRPDVAEQVERALAELDASQREAVRLRFLLDLDYREVAIVLGVSENACRIRVHRALAKLKKRLGVGAATLIASLALPAPANAAGLVRSAIAGAKATGAATTVATTMGAFAMSTTTKIAVATCAALLIGLGLWLATPRDLREPHAPGERAARSTPGAARDETAGTDATAVDADAPPPVDDVAHPIRLAGRVVGARRLPVAGATVELHDGTTRRTTTSDAAGRFELAADAEAGYEPRRVALVARDAEGRVATAFASVRTNDVDVGAMILEREYEISVEVVDGGRPVAGARVDVAFRTTVRYEARPRFATVVVSDAAGRATLVVPRGRVEVDAASGDRRGRIALRTPDDGSGPHRLELGPTRSLDVVVTEFGTGQPVAGATVEVYRHVVVPAFRSIEPYEPPAITVAPTDADGETVVRGLYADDELTLCARGASEVAWLPSARHWVKVESGATSAHLLVESPVTHRWPVVAGERPIPADGATIRLIPAPDAELEGVPTSGRMVEGELEVTGFGPRMAAAIAIAPDGSLARIHGIPRASKPLSFRAPRSLDVVVLGEGERPVPDATVSLWTGAYGGLVVPPRATDADGHVRFEGLYGVCVDVRATTDPAVRAAAAGTVELAAGGSSYVVRLRPEIEVVARVTIDGRPELPARYTLDASDGTPLAIDEDPSAGVVRARLRPAGDRPFGLLFRGETFENASFEIDPHASSPIEVELPLRRAGMLRVDVPGPSRHTLMLERWDADREAWVAEPRISSEAEVGGPSTVLYRALPVGRYRVVDRRAGVESDPVDVAASGEPMELALDASGVGEVTGRVEVPNGIDRRLIRVVTDQDRTELGRPGRGIDAEGRFRIPTTEGRRLRIRATHPLLVADPAMPEAVADGAAHGVVLRLVEGGRGTVTLDPMPPIDPWLARPPRVVYFAGEPTGDPVASSELVATKDGRAAFGGVARGTYTLWFDVSGFAPRVVRSVELGDGPTAIGRVALARGSTLRVRLLVPKGSPAVSSVWAKALDGPPYVRVGGAKRGASDVVVAGLGPGRFELSVYREHGAAPPPRTIRVDGETEVELEIDLR